MEPLPREIPPTKSHEDWLREIEAIIGECVRVGGQGLPDQRSPAVLSYTGRARVMAVISSIHDDGYTLGLWRGSPPKNKDGV